jgi:hypothetical protein
MREQHPQPSPRATRASDAGRGSGEVGREIAQQERRESVRARRVMEVVVMPPRQGHWVMTVNKY